MNNEFDSSPDDSGFFGVMNDISLMDYIQLICMKNSTKAIRVTQQEQNGLIYIDGGRVIFASQDALQGVAALQQILAWKKGSFREVKINKIPPANIDKNFRLPFSENSSENGVKTLSIPTNNHSPSSQASRLPRQETIGQAGSGQGQAKRQPTTSSQVNTFDHWPPKEKEQRKLPVKKKHAIIAGATFLSLCLVILFLQLFFFNDTTPLSAQAITTPQPIQASEAAKSQAAVKGQAAVTPSSGKTPGAADKSISIGTLVKTEEKKALPEETILRLHGSNTIGAHLAPALISGYLTTIMGAEKVEQVLGKEENEVIIKGRFKDQLKVVELHAHGSTTGFKGLMEEKCDIGMASRKIKEKEVLELSKYGNMTAPTNEHVIALDGIAVIVNKANKIAKLEMQDLAAIFSGKITNWSQVGGEPGEITTYARDENSGTYDTFKSIVLDKLELKPGTKRFESNPELSEQVSRDPSAIGFTSLPNIQKSKAVAIADTGAKPIFPSFFTVATEDYPIARRLYLYTATNPTNSHVHNFIEFVHSQKGQEITNKIDMVDMNIKTFHSEKADPALIQNKAAISDYLKATDNAQRLSLNFRFNSGKVTLDNRGERDLLRVVDFLKERLEKQIILAGFADNAGDYDINLKLARIRADTVAEQLRARGLAVHYIASAGEELPVATNLSPGGKEKNRRVEVWLK